jgi:hypothetical protein
MDQLRGDLSHFNREVIEEIKKHKWIQSEKAGHDLNGPAALEWIEKYYELWLQWRLEQEQNRKAS